ncbi:MAG: alanine racemase [Motiliproteus sp.]|nr:alanine racemase [Motiliproteus sp.]
MTRPARAIVNLNAIRHNYQTAKSLIPNAKATAIVKANAYGHGAVAVAQALASEADAFGVACLEEALELRQAGITNPILLLEGFFEAEELEAIDQYDLETAIHNQQQIEWLKKAKLQRPLKIWLKIDTGMGRLGFNTEQFPDAYRQLNQSSNTDSIVLMSHFARADETQCDETQNQIERFQSVTQGLNHPISLANSPGILAWPQSQGDWIRPGMMLYGASPLDHGNANSAQLKSAMTLQSGIISIKEFQPGESIGYGAHFTCQRPSKIAVVAMGYGDGYPRTAPPNTPVLINGQRCPLVGRVSMDMLTVDVTDLDQVDIGDGVIFWGEDLTVTEVAEHCGTIGYEMVTRLTGRAPLVYR